MYKATPWPQKYHAKRWLRPQVALAAIAALATIACNDGPTAPRPGSLRVTVATTGGDLDLDGYRVVVDSGPGVLLQPNATALLDGISPQTHTVELQGVADNCTVVGAHPLTVTVPSGGTAAAALSVTCDATGIAVATKSTGPDQPFEFQVEVAILQYSVPVNGTIVVSRVPPGNHQVLLTTASSNCTVIGANPITVQVSNRAVTPAAFEIACVAVPHPEKIAFVLDSLADHWIALMDPDGSHVVHLVRDGRQPAWSPDGSKLVFSNAACLDYYTCSGGLVLVDPESGTSRILTRGGEYPAWSPDGQRIAFTYISTLDLVRLDGTDAPGLVVIPQTAVSHPVWSPDGQRIAFSCQLLAPPPIHSHLCIVNSDGNGLQELTNDAAEDSSPVWSPDGNTIAFVTNRFNLTFDVAVIGAAGGEVTRLTSGFDPAWSRDGSKIVFARSDGLFTVNRDGSNVIRLTTGTHREPAWRP